VAVYTVSAHRERLEAAFQRASQVEDLRVQADLAQLLCVLVAGFLEQATRHLLKVFASNRSDPRVTRYVERRLARFRNANPQKLCDLLGDFDPELRTRFEEFIKGERRDSIQSVVANRHQIAHGEQVELTYHRIRGYFVHVRETVDFLENECTS